MRRSKTPAGPTLREAVDELGTALRAALIALDSLPKTPQPPPHWREDDADIAEAYEMIRRLDAAQLDGKIGLIARLLREEQDRRWAAAPAISATELERRIAEQQQPGDNTFGFVEQFCRHCGRGYMLDLKATVDINGDVHKDEGRCRCGRNDFVYRKHPDDPETHGVYRVSMKGYQPAPPGNGEAYRTAAKAILPPDPQQELFPLRGKP